MGRWGHASWPTSRGRWRRRSPCSSSAPRHVAGGGDPMSERFDVVVVGSGPGGYVSAIRAAQLGRSVAVVEADRPGGICLNWGCIPTKALLRNAELVQLFRRAADFGVTVDNLRVDYLPAYQRSRQVADRMAKGVEFLFRKNKITLVAGRGELVSPGAVRVTPTGGGAGSSRT